MIESDWDVDVSSGGVFQTRGPPATVKVESWRWRHQRRHDVSGRATTDRATAGGGGGGDGPSPVGASGVRVYTAVGRMVSDVRGWTSSSDWSRRSGRRAPYVQNSPQYRHVHGPSTARRRAQG